MSGTEIAEWTLEGVRDAIAAGEVSSVEATQSCLTRLKERGPALNAVAEITEEKVLNDAADADAQPGDQRGPLHGVPLAHKDMFYRAGRISGCGSKIRADFRPDVTSGALTRLDQAGALDMARLNMVEFALGVTGHNDITGDVRNPWNRDHVPGGSSSGSGAAVASRCTFGALGSDTGGSVRLPAACCGIVGMKVTLGRVSRAGAMPLSTSLDTIGPLTRTVRDNALMFETLAGYDPNDPASARIKVPDVMSGIEAGATGLTVAVPENYFFEDIDPEVADLVDAARQTLEAAGARMIPVRVPDETADTNVFTRFITAVEGAALHSHWMETRPEDYGPRTIERFRGGLAVAASRYVQALNARAPLLQRFTETVFDHADMLLTPMLPDPVVTLNASGDDYVEMTHRMGHASRSANYLGLPGLSVPCGFTGNGLPTAFQLVGRPFGEAVLYRAGRAYERETGWTDRAPVFP